MTEPELERLRAWLLHRFAVYDAWQQRKQERQPSAAEQMRKADPHI